MTDYDKAKAEVDRISQEQIRWRVMNPGVENPRLNDEQARAYKWMLSEAAAREANGERP